ncbi:MAG: NAD(P)/FAD-dependent oxidoreductase [Pseudomonadota bacterium]
MTDITLKTDYLIAGAGAVGMSFADVILTETDADIILFDSRAKPGGHWNDAYPFVTLHQPSQYYGVSSKELSSGLRDEVGLNKGMADLASGAEVNAYFDQVMRQTFLPSGRVRWFPMCDWLGGTRFQNRLTGQTYSVEAAKTVDATFLKTSIPSRHTPNFTVSGAKLIPLNDLPDVATPPDGYTVIGGGKTGIDACLWLLEMGVAPKDIRWITPRDGWMLDRANTQPSMDFFEQTLGSVANQFESIAYSTSIDDMFDRLEACGYFVRIDKDVRPKMFHGATISQAELAALREIKNVVRMGRVKSLGATEIVLDGGTVPTTPGTLHVDCSASAITNEEIKPIFADDLITPQMVRSYQPIFSAAFIAHIEATRADDAEKNRLCGVVPLPNHDTDFIRFTSAFMLNQYNWSQEEDLRQWLLENRLDGFSKLVSQVTPEDTAKKAILKRIKEASFPAGMKLQGYVSELKKCGMA